MRKNYFFLLLFVICLPAQAGYLLSVIPSPVLAQSITLPPKTASAAATTTLPTPNNAIEKLKQIEQLKEKIATKVAELREKDKRAVSGVVKKITGTSFLITNRKGDEYSISYSDDTTFYTVIDGERKETSAKK